MDRTSSNNTVRLLQHVPSSIMLPNDIIPNIHSRLPTTDLFALASVCKQTQVLIQPLLRDAAERELGAFSPRELKTSVQRRAVLLRIGGHLISDEAWTDFLQNGRACQN